MVEIFSELIQKWKICNILNREHNCYRESAWYGAFLEMFRCKSIGFPRGFSVTVSLNSSKRDERYKSLITCLWTINYGHLFRGLNHFKSANHKLQFWFSRILTDVIVLTFLNLICFIQKDKILWIFFFGTKIKTFTKWLESRKRVN